MPTAGQATPSCAVPGGDTRGSDAVHLGERASDDEPAIRLDFDRENFAVGAPANRRPNLGDGIEQGQVADCQAAGRRKLATDDELFWLWTAAVRVPAREARDLPKYRLFTGLGLPVGFALLCEKAGTGDGKGENNSEDAAHAVGRRSRAVLSRVQAGILARSYLRFGAQSAR